MIPVRPKKNLGQHFLKDDNIARKIVFSLQYRNNVLEIGPGYGILTKHLVSVCQELKVIEIDSQAVAHLLHFFPDLQNNIILGDFLQSSLNDIFSTEFSVIGNLPYNISSPIFFKIIENRHLIPEVVCMIQKEVAERITASPGNKVYGILSVLFGAFYDIKYLFTVSEKVFYPEPAVKSAVIRATRKENYHLPVAEDLFFDVVKSAFQQRRKTLRNSLRLFWENRLNPEQFPIFSQRPEQLSIEDFIRLTSIFQHATPPHLK